ncbi:sensor histidine kinase [Thiohalomonas denitrificans]|uniref:histidine kinase n=1 Tax=Thiohalomonas denitrificans TaxID=415747 RepID=A0A1G5Q9M9_9GAMM|nr:ATP-binding protein [Thiohalomonas denitrificans]SCZ58286.1 His Kinase A (phospho-acceptor) domain-containing protein [Thiohalomonas denitrificans]
MSWLQKGRSLALKPWVPWLVFAVIVGGALAVAIGLYRLENTRHQTHFALAVREQMAVLESGIHLRFRPVHHLALTASFQAGTLDERSFLRFVKSIPQQGSLVALQWFPRQQARPGQETFPMGYSYSLSDELSESESDWSQVPNRLIDPAKKRELMIIPWYMMDGRVRFRVLRPVFRRGTDERELLGFVSGLYQVDRLLTDILCLRNRSDAMEIFVTDPRSDVTDSFRCSTNARGMRFDTGAFPPGRRLTRSVPVDGTTWIMTAVATPGTFIASRWIPFVIGFGGLLLGGILALLHRLMLDREAKVRQLVYRRTEQLEAMNRELEQFAYVASHDLKAPLRAVSQLSSWIIEDAADQLDEENRNRLRLMRDRVIRMDQLIDGLLTYSRAGRVTGEARKSVSLKLLLEELSGELSLPAGFRVEIREPLPSLQADALHLKQIFQNLITNAASHHDHPESGTVWVRAEEEERFWRVEIADDGPGILAEERQRIFGMFMSLRPDAGQGHTGIGLTIVRKLVLSYGGQVDVVDNLPRGARFRIWWPKSINH